MKYRFDVPPKKHKVVLPSNLIPKALKRARSVKPDKAIQPMWEGAVYRQLEQPDPQFSWRDFVMSLVP